MLKHVSMYNFSSTGVRCRRFAGRGSDIGSEMTCAKSITEQIPKKENWSYFAFCCVLLILDEWTTLFECGASTNSHPEGMHRPESNLGNDYVIIRRLEV